MQYLNQVECECGEQVESGQLARHKQQSCAMREVTCSYCSYACKQLFMNEHEERCGARTKLCDKCNKFIQLRGKSLS